MDEITPDMISRIASRLYNEPPNAKALPAAETPLPEPSSVAPTGMPSPPVSVPHNSFPVHSGGMPGPSALPVGSPPAVPPNPGMGNLPTSPSFPGVPFSPPGFGGVPSFGGTPTFIHAPAFPAHGSAAEVPGAQGTSGGLSAFVQSIRASHFPGRNNGLGATAVELRERQALNKQYSAQGSRPMDVNAVRGDFPILRQRVHGKPLAWLDNAATTQKPQSVIDAISHFYENDNSNIHRAAHTLAARATDAYESARQKVQAFIGASSVKEIVFVRGTTEGINLIAKTYGAKFLQPGDEIVLSNLEHHANIVPWQMVAKEKGAHIRVIPVNDRGEIMMEEYQKILGPRTKIVGLTQASNSLGTILPVHEMTQIAKRYGARVLIDGAQSVAHIPVNVQELGADFFVFSGHKIFGPTGIGAVYIKEELHDFVPPWQGGGNMIRNVTFEETSYSEAPAKFEAGTPNIADAVGLGAALDYVNRLGLPNIAAYEHHLLEYGTEQLLRINGLRLIGTAREKVGVLSFVLPSKRTEEIGRHLDQEGIAVRSGHHCSQPSLRRMGVETTVRPSLSIYNTCSEIDRLADAIRRIQRLPS
ncbi:Cysteine desulfurase [Anatilimnocola aggregata]|uniref:cysteine desulfurase n=1 Tax=Anatilimnocola aggregata TaxID=2528021 RepID=A0A517YM58_9BACT|nr:SufS family cysteine desulfurase [Anatilimnocola aggregata]QDU31304.1 Cysteine desulfurase [Anatilimnocola aggregata]